MGKRKPFMQTLERLKSRCIEEGECWLWQGANDGNGRPVVVHMGARIPARRLARQLADDRIIPDTRQVTCTCGNLDCISPACSIVATPATTHKMASARGSYRNAARDRRMAVAKRANSPITEDVVQKIREAESGRAAADSTGVSYSHAKAIRAGRARKEYANPFSGLGAANDSNRRRA
jgi:hypothetical protein